MGLHKNDKFGHPIYIIKFTNKDKLIEVLKKINEDILIKFFSFQMIIYKNIVLKICSQ